MQTANPMWMQILEPRRLLAAGELDTTFGVGGAMSVPAASNESISSVVELPDGKLLAAARVGDKLELVRLDAQGALDPTFGAGGRLLTDLLSAGRRIAVSASDGRIAVGGADLNIAIFAADGSLQRDLSVRAALGLSAQSTRVPQFGFAPDGKLLVASHGGADENELRVVRFNINGTLDTSFGDGGKVVIDDFSLQRFLVNDDGSALVFGVHGETFVDPDFGTAESHVQQNLYSIDTAGAVTTNFWGGGIDVVVTDVTDMARGADGSVAVLFDDIAPNVQIYPHVQRVSRRGERIGQQTVVSLDFNFRELRAGVEPSGRVPVAGFDLQNRWIVERFNSTGGKDTSYADNGAITLNLSAIDTDPGDATVLADGDVLIAANHFRKDGQRDFVFMRVQGGAAPTFTAILNIKGELTIQGTPNADFINITRRKKDDRVVIRSGDYVQSFPYFRVSVIAAIGGDGDDRISIDAGIAPVVLDGGAGNDTLTGGDYNDTLVGRGGDDLLIGDGGFDQLFGDDGRDKLVGGGERDYLLGGAGRDDLYGGDDRDTLSGAGGNDRLFGNAGVDRIVGGAGANDLAEDDLFDSFATIERFLGSDKPVDLAKLNGPGSLASFTTANLSRAFKHYADSAAQMPDGRVVVAGYNANYNLELARFNADGSPDLTFGEGGAVATTLNVNAVKHPAPVAVTADGRVAVVLSDENSATVAMFTSSGAADATFGDEGILDAGAFQTANELPKIAFTPGGKLVVAGAVFRTGNDNGAIAVRQFDAAGAPDPTFGSAGEATVVFPDDCIDLIVTPDGRITFAANIYHFGGDNFTNFVVGQRLYRLTSSGALDPTFDSDGELVVSNQGDLTSNFVLDMDIAADGTIATLSNERVYDNEYFVRRFDASGRLLGQRVALPFGDISIARRVALDSAGRFMILGEKFIAPPFIDSFVWRYSAAGVRDETWRHDGRAPLPLIESRAMLLQSSGDILIAGATPGHKTLALLSLRGG